MPCGRDALQKLSLNPPTPSPRRLKINTIRQHQGDTQENNVETQVYDFQRIKNGLLYNPSAGMPPVCPLYASLQANMRRKRVFPRSQKVTFSRRQSVFQNCLASRIQPAYMQERTAETAQAQLLGTARPRFPNPPFSPPRPPHFLQCIQGVYLEISTPPVAPKSFLTSPVSVRIREVQVFGCKIGLTYHRWRTVRQ